MLLISELASKEKLPIKFLSRFYAAKNPALYTTSRREKFRAIDRIERGRRDKPWHTTESNGCK
jgi:hypothetical protein